VQAVIKNKPHTKLLVDGGDSHETRRIRELLGFIDGQTNNPSLVAKNPEFKQRMAAVIRDEFLFKRESGLTITWQLN
jgi:transaldolase